jgi:general secretion pathway protein L
LVGVIKPDIPLTLLPIEMKKKERRIGKFLLILLISLAVLVSFIQAGKGFYQYRDELRSVNEEIKKKKPEVETVEKLQKQQGTLDKEISELEKILSEEISMIEMLKELTRLLPPSVWIWNLKYNGKEIEISGFADSASDLISLIDKSPFFDKVEFMAPVTKERQVKPEGPQEKERFKIKARIEAKKTGS